MQLQLIQQIWMMVKALCNLINLFTISIQSTYYLVSINRNCYLYDGSVTLSEIKAYSELYDLEFSRDDYCSNDLKYSTLAYSDTDTIPYEDKDSTIAEFLNGIHSDWIEQNETGITRIRLKPVYSRSLHHQQLAWYDDPQQIINDRAPSSWIKHQLPGGRYFKGESGIRIHDIHIPFKFHKSQGKTIADMKEYYQGIFKDPAVSALLQDQYWSTRLEIDHFQFLDWDSPDDDTTVLVIEGDPNRVLTNKDYDEYFQIVWIDKKGRLFIQDQDACGCAGGYCLLFSNQPPANNNVHGAASARNASRNRKRRQRMLKNQRKKRFHLKMHQRAQNQRLLNARTSVPDVDSDAVGRIRLGTSISQSPRHVAQDRMVFHGAVNSSHNGRAVLSASEDTDDRQTLDTVDPVGREIRISEIGIRKRKREADTYQDNCDCDLQDSEEDEDEDGSLEADVNVSETTIGTADYRLITACILGCVGIMLIVVGILMLCCRLNK